MASFNIHVPVTRHTKTKHGNQGNAYSALPEGCVLNGCPVGVVEGSALLPMLWPFSLPVLMHNEWSGTVKTPKYVYSYGS